ncbi:hypothetical protein [Deinococcus misasensis]|uniref:hypothetical protein n=1 Tax=Deinococcus misasensis TaxID=392413 RepID=UPI00147055C5|nr:hypothetical protein [Deinococcus misasensis]
MNMSIVIQKGAWSLQDLLHIVMNPNSWMLFSSNVFEVSVRSVELESKSGRLVMSDFERCKFLIEGSDEENEVVVVLRYPSRHSVVLKLQIEEFDGYFRMSLLAKHNHGRGKNLVEPEENVLQHCVLKAFLQFSNVVSPGPQH